MVKKKIANNFLYPPPDENTRYANSFARCCCTFAQKIVYCGKIVNSGFGGKTMRFLFKYLTQIMFWIFVSNLFLPLILLFSDSQHQTDECGTDTPEVVSQKLQRDGG